MTTVRITIRKPVDPLTAVISARRDEYARKWRVPVRIEGEASNFSTRPSMAEKRGIAEKIIEIFAIEMTAKRFNCTPESVLRRMVFSYAAKFDSPDVKPDTANVVTLRRDE